METRVYPFLDIEHRRSRLEPPRGLVRAVLDTDTYNEIDDQFALAYAILAPERIRLEAVYAAPFHNDRSSSPGDGMRKSYDEILRLLALLGRRADGLAYRGSDAYLPSPRTPLRSAATDDLIARAMAPDETAPLYIIAIGAPTNVASALLLEPRLLDRVVVVWLGGTDRHHASAEEFNLRQDPAASRILLDSGVPLVRVPCANVASHLQTTIPELEAELAGHNALGHYLLDIVKAYGGGPAWSKVIWDIATVAWLIDPAWVPTALLPSPVLTNALTWQTPPDRHLVREATFVHRDAVFGDLFARIRAFGPEAH